MGTANSDAFRRSPPYDVQILTSDGRTIDAHSSVLAAASPVLERLIRRGRRRCSAQSTLRIFGVPFDSVAAFLRLLYSPGPREAEEWEEVMREHGVRLLALGHAYKVGWVKRGAEEKVAARLTAEGVVDMLKLAKLCDARRLYLRCARLAAQDFAAVEKSEGWRFALLHDRRLQLELLRLIHDEGQRRKRWKRLRKSQEVYEQLSEAMDSLEHIVAEGCTEHSPTCDRFRPCQGLHQLILHFAVCSDKLCPGGCRHCKRMYQLLRLHSSVCDCTDESCKLPLCGQFKTKMQTEDKVDNTWDLLVKKVIGARVMSSLADRNRKRPDIVARSWARYRRRNKLRKN